MKRKYYIAYGSNINIAQMSHRCPDAVVIGQTEIKDYMLTFRGRANSAVATIEPCAGESVPVLVWAISPNDELALDVYEGFPHLYKKQIFDVELKGKSVSAMAYVMTPGRPYGKPSDYYLGIIEDGYVTFNFDTADLLEAVISSSVRSAMEK